MSTTPVRFAYTHADTHLIDYAPIIEHDAGAQVVGIRFSPKLDFVPLLPEDQFDAFYRARRGSVSFRASGDGPDDVEGS